MWKQFAVSKVEDNGKGQVRGSPVVLRRRPWPGKEVVQEGQQAPQLGAELSVGDKSSDLERAKQREGRKEGEEAICGERSRFGAEETARKTEGGEVGQRVEEEEVVVRLEANGIQEAERTQPARDSMSHLRGREKERTEEDAALPSSPPCQKG